MSRYWDFICDYADDFYAENCKKWYILTDTKCKNLSVIEQEKLDHIFEKASLLELDFWNMTYKRENE